MSIRHIAGVFSLLSIAGLGQLAGCKSEEPTTTKTTTEKKATQATAADSDVEDLREFLGKDATESDSSALPPGHPPLSGAAPPAARGNAALPDNHPPIGAAPAPEVDLQFEVADAWQEQKATSPMRLAQYRIPGNGEDAQDGELIVFQFGPSDGGPVKNNIDRWEAMFTTEDGRPVTDAVIDVRDIGGLRVTTLDVAGQYDDPMRARSGGAPIAGKARLLAAIVETPKGRYFFKAIGPKGTIDANESAFEQLIASFRLEP